MPKTKSRLASVSVAAWVLLLVTTAESRAALITVDNVLNFSSPTESIFGGAGSVAFGIDELLGSTNFGISVNGGASSGTVKANVNGSLSATFENVVPINQANAVSVDLDYNGSTGLVDTFLGASMLVQAHVLDNTPVFDLFFPVDLFNQNYSLDIDKTFAPNIGATVTGTDAFTPASVSVGPSFPLVGSAQAGVDFDIEQTASFRVDALTGVLSARHEGGTTQVRTINLGASDQQTILLDLSLEGIWEIQLTSLMLDNTFSTDFDLNINPFVAFILGFNCGDPGTDSDNNEVFPFFGCILDDKASFPLADFDLFSTPDLGLGFNTINSLQTFSIRIDPLTPSAVPEPTTLALFALGLAGFSFAGRRRSEGG